MCETPLPHRAKSLRYFTQLTLARQNLATSDAKRFFHTEVTKLMKQVIRRGSVVLSPEPLLPTVIQLSLALSHTHKTLRLAHGYAQRTCEIASQCLKADPGSPSLKHAKLACYRHLALLCLRWYKLNDAEALCKKVCTDATALFGKASVELQTALTLYAHVLVVAGGDKVKVARTCLHSVWTLLQSGTSELAREMHALAGSNYVASLYCAGSLPSCIRIMQDLSGRSTQRVWTVITTNLGLVLAGMCDPVSSASHLELVLKSCVAAAGDGSVDALATSTLLMGTMLDLGRYGDIQAMGDGILARCKRTHAPHVRTRTPALLCVCACCERVCACCERGCVCPPPTGAHRARGPTGGGGVDSGAPHTRPRTPAVRAGAAGGQVWGQPPPVPRNTGSTRVRGTGGGGGGRLRVCGEAA